ncbi:MAG: FtsW/RodA/SpoVE family cell cycle protein [Lachnospiraceae bacterium]|nr:FtsW/RodA/SpoVE family cell cycle protein [Lachnospiraceae bacterium]
MAGVILEISKYFLLIFMAVYTGLMFPVVRRKDDDPRRGIYFGLELLAVLIFGLGMTDVILGRIDTGNTDNMMQLLLVALAELLFLIFLPMIMRALYHDVNNILLCQMQLLLGLGFVVLARLNFRHAKRQFVIVLISSVIFMILPLLLKKLYFLSRLTWIYGGLGLAALLVVLLTGNLVNGSKLTYHILGLTFQPSEAVKLLFVFFIAGLLSEATDLKRVFLSAGLAAAHVLVLVASRDLGSALIFFVIYVAMLHVATGKHRYLLAGIAGGLVAAVAAYFLFSHVRVRVQVWLAPFSDPDNKGYQLTQSLFGLATGSWFGLGVGHGMPDVIPFVEEDFVFSAIAEEFGVLFGILLILVCLGVVLAGLVMAGRVKDPFYRLVAVGLSVCYGVQVILTIGGGTGLIPLTGVTLPLISSGGTSILITMVLFSMLQGIYMIRMEEYDAEEWEAEEYEKKLAGWEARKKRLTRQGYTPEEIDAEEAAFFAEEDELEALRQEEKEIRAPQDKSIFVNGLIYSGVFLLMFANILRFMIMEGDTAMVNSYNGKRMAILENDNTRGTIYAADGSVLAGTSKDEEGNEKREYPYGEVFAHPVGYAVRGGAGIERQMLKYLITSDVSLGTRMENDLNRRKDPGNDVYTTLEPKLQKAAYDAMGERRGAVVVTEVKTGRVLAMVSKPVFDPYTVEEKWEELLKDDESGRLVNRGTQGQYAPGSTFKIVTVLEYIREHPSDYGDYEFICSGKLVAGGTSIQCYHGTVHGEVDLTESFAKSCNSSFANIGLGLDRDSFAKTLEELYFNKEIPASMDHKQSHVSMRKDMAEDKVMQTAIGQGDTLMSPLHLNMITAALANNGEMMQPYMIETVMNGDGKVLKAYSPKVIGTIADENELRIMHNLMEAVVDHGTAQRLKDLPMSMAGKTGSAEFSSNKQQSHAWFTGYAPADAPEIAVTVILENAGSGGEMAAPIAGAVVRAYAE